VTDEFTLITLRIYYGSLTS